MMLTRVVKNNIYANINLRKNLFSGTASLLGKETPNEVYRWTSVNAITREKTHSNKLRYTPNYNAEHLFLKCQRYSFVHTWILLNG